MMSFQKLINLSKLIKVLVAYFIAEVTKLWFRSCEL